MVVSCRLRQGVDLGGDFLRLDVRPLDPARRRAFIHRYFHALCRVLTLSDDRIPEAEARAHKQAGELADKLEDSSFEMWSLVSTPLLLALLCIVAYRDGEIPPRRSDFYRECLAVLLRWRRQADVEPFCELGDALLLLEPLAAYLHAKERREDLTVAEVEAHFGKAIDRAARTAGHRKGAAELIRWLHEDASVLAHDREDEYGFVHLGFQEYLAARHLSRNQDFDAIAAGFGAADGKQVLLLALGLEEPRVFEPVMARLARPEHLIGNLEVFEECFREARGITAEPFLPILMGEAPDAAKAVILRLFLHRDDPEIPKAAVPLLCSESPDVAALAEQLVGEEVQSRPAMGEVVVRETREFDVFLSYGAWMRRRCGRWPSS